MTTRGLGNGGHILAVAAVVLLALAPPATPAVQTAASDDARMYAAVLNYLARGIRARERALIVLPSTSISMNASLRELGFPPASPEDIAYRLPGAHKETIEDFLRRSETPTDVALSGRIDRRMSVTVVSSAEIADFLHASDATAWQHLKKKHPGARYVMHFSPIGFNSASTEALVYVSRLCEGLCGGGELILFRRHGGAWRIKHVRNVWIA